MAFVLTVAEFVWGMDRTKQLLVDVNKHADKPAIYIGLVVEAVLHPKRTPDYPYRGQITIRTPSGPEGPGGQLIIRTNRLLKSRRPVESSRHRPTRLKEVRSSSGHREWLHVRIILLTFFIIKYNKYCILKTLNAKILIGNAWRALKYQSINWGISCVLQKRQPANELSEAIGVNGIYLLLTL